MEQGMIDPTHAILVTKLLTLSACAAGCEGRCRVCPDEVAREAGKAIEQLSARIQHLKAALRGNPFPAGMTPQERDLAISQI